MAQTGSDEIDVTFQGGPDAAVVEHINVTVNNMLFGRAAAIDTEANNGVTAFPTLGDFDSTVAVGTTVTLEDTTSTDYITADRDHIIATATFLDGSQQVVLDTYV